MLKEKASIIRRFKLTIAYDGTAYFGWQVQPRFPSVQETIETELARITGHIVKVNGSGRTDQGVHARGQVAHTDLKCRMGPVSLMRALNSRLPPDIRILKITRAKPVFHARKSATAKEYRYFVWNDELILPDKRLYSAHIYRPLDLARMRDAAKRFVGRHDFISFMANPSRVVTTSIRTISDFTITRKGKEICFRVRGQGFLYKQVRSMVGFLLCVGTGDEPPEAVTEILDACAPRTARVQSAAPCGLFLWKVWYTPGKRQEAQD